MHSRRGKDTTRSPGSEFVTGMKKTSVTPAATSSDSRSPVKGSQTRGGKRTEKEPPSIPKQQQQTSSPTGQTVSSPTKKQLDSIVDVVTDRVIDKLCRMDVSSPARRAIFRSTANDNHVPLIDLKRFSVVMITVTARRPVPGGKMDLFRGTIHLNTNDIRLSEDVDKLMADERAKSARKTAPTAEEAEAGDAANEGASQSEDDTDEDPDSGTEKGAKAVSDATSSSGVTSASSQSISDHGVDAGNSASGTEDQIVGSKSQRSLSQRDPRGRKIGSTIQCKKLSSVETRFEDRILKLRNVIESNGYDFTGGRTVDQTEIARITHGIDLIAFQRMTIFRRAKTEEDMMYAMGKGMMPEAGSTSIFDYIV